MASTATGKKLHLIVGDKTLNMVEFLSDKGNEWYSLTAKKADGTRYVSMYGIAKPALAPSLPVQVSILDPETQESVPVYLAKSKTDDSREKAAFSGQVTLPNGTIRNLRVSFSVTKSGDWNIVAKATPFGQGSGSRTTDWDDED